MENPETGDVSFEARDKTYTLRYTTAAFVALEAFLDRGIIDIYEELSTWAPKFDPATRKPEPETNAQAIARAKKMRLGFMRAVFWAGFHDLHRDVTIDEAGDIMAEIGGMIAAYSLVMGGIASAQVKADSGANAAARPQKGASRRRTGSTS